MIPLARYGKEKSLTMSPYKGITLAMPGRHAEDTTPKGGDFVVMVTDAGMKWKNHQFKHSDIFDDIQVKYDHDPTLPTELDLLMRNYMSVLADDEAIENLVIPVTLPGISTKTFLYAVQCLAVAEHRRYYMHENKYGGRFLPFRFVAGIAEGLWTAAEGGTVQKYGRPAVERLEKDNGVPVLTQKLLANTP
jgi:hypothetical protein